MNVFLVNDTSKVEHVGCLAVSDAHRKMIGQVGGQIAFVHHVGEGEELYKGDEEGAIQNVLESNWGKAVYESDVIIVNGEGTIHHGAGLHLLAILGAAQRLGKPTFLINAVLQEVEGFEFVFKQLTGFTVREPLSAKVGRALGGSPKVLPDSIVDANFLDQPTVDFHNEIVVGDGHWLCGDTIEALNIIGKGKRRWLLAGSERRKDWRHSVANLKTARLYVTGRHHGVYLAALAGIPFVALPSNTHKIESLIEWSCCDIPVCHNAYEVVAAIEYSLRHRDEFLKFQKFILSFISLNTFDGIGKFDIAKKQKPPLRLRWIWFLNHFKHR